MTIGAALREGIQQLQSRSDAPRLDAERLLLHVLERRETSWLHAHDTDALASQAYTTFVQAAQQRAAGMPLAYLIGEAGFYGRSFAVSPAVLIPRPATEDLVDVALAAIADRHRQYGRPLIIADIGTGSGCIAITLALETTPAQIGRIYATDISPEALAVAQQNAADHGVADRITFVEHNLLEAGKTPGVFGDLTPGVKEASIDLIVSNPPYIPTTELAHAAQHPDTIGLAFEPRAALDGGQDGQRYIAPLPAAGIPLIVEVTGGKIKKFN